MGSPKHLLRAIMMVQTGLWTATEAARQLGVSRKTYYQWEARALSGMRSALIRRRPGRPSRAPPKALARVRRQLDRTRTELQLTQQRLHVLRILSGVKPRSKKKRGRDGRAPVPPAPA
jgi:transposase